MRGSERIGELIQTYVRSLHPLHPHQPDRWGALFIFLFTSIPYAVLLSVSLSGKLTELCLLIPPAFLLLWVLASFWLWIVNSLRQFSRTLLLSSNLLSPHLPTLLALAPYLHLFGVGIYGLKALYFWGLVLGFVLWSLMMLGGICLALGMGRRRLLVAALLPALVVPLSIHFGIIYLSNGNFSLLDFFRLL
jgi:hypothetical protein